MNRDDELLEQSVRTVEQYFHRAEWQIDSQFGEGFAKKNPAAEFVRASSAEFYTAMFKLAAQDIREGLSLVAESFAKDA